MIEIARQAVEAARFAYLRKTPAAALPANAHGAVSLLLSNDSRLRELNSRFLNKDRPTNVLSFPYIESRQEGDAIFWPDCEQEENDPTPLGDIAVAFETAAAEAAEEGQSLENRLRLLAAHGCLHLLGMRHDADEDAEEMESLEKEILATLQNAASQLTEEKAARA